MTPAFMRQAIETAIENVRSGRGGPFAALIVKDGRVIASGTNQVTAANDPTAHAEIVALREAARVAGNYRLSGATLYVTIEPCAMCAGAMLQARIVRLVYGADDAKAGAVRSCFSMLGHPHLNHRVEVTSGVFAEQAVELLQNFFAARR